MPGQREIVSALFGAWRLMRFDADGMNWFNLTINGFWRSFFAAVPVAPFFALLVFFDFHRQTGPIDVGHAIIVTIMVYGVGWAIVPLIMIPMTKLLGLERGFVPMMVAYNWVTLPQIVIQVLAVLPGASGLVSEELSGTLLFAVVIWGCFGLGMAHDGRLALRDQRQPFLTSLQVIANLGVGLADPLARIGIYGRPVYLLPPHGPRPEYRERSEIFRQRARSGVAIYGTAYLWTAGLMNLLLLFDIWDLGRRRRD